MQENIYRAIAALLIVAGSGISIYFRRRADRASGGERISLRAENPALRVGLRVVGPTLWLCVFGYIINPAWLAWSQLPLPALARLSGAAIGVSAVGLAFWVFKNLGNNVTPTVVTRARHELVTEGPYRWVRHPLYSVGLLSYLGFALLAANWFVALLSIIVFGILVLRVPLEERALIERHGDAYRAYTRRTGKFLPRLG